MRFLEVRKVKQILEKSKILRLNTNPMYFSVSAARSSNHSVAQLHQTRSAMTNQSFRNLSSQSSPEAYKEGKGLVIGQRFPLLKEMAYKSFIEEYPAFVQDVLGLKELEGITAMSDQIRESMDYNVPHGKLLRPMLLLAIAMQAQEKAGQDLPNLNRIGWAYEMIQASATMTDDIVDESITRRDKPCWYLAGNHGLNSINTALRLQSSMFVIMKKYAKEHYPLYTEILEVLMENSLRLWYGQELDGSISIAKEFHRFTPDTYTRMMTSKNGYYIFYTPIAIGLMLNRINNTEILRKLEQFSMELGLLYSAQDDFLDCFVDPSKTGKIGTDIQDGKPSWLIVNAMKKATKGQRQILLDNYGNKDPEKIAVIKTMYEELGLPEAFYDYEKQTNFSLLTQIDELPQVVPKKVLQHLVEILNKRSR